MFFKLLAAKAKDGTDAKKAVNGIVKVLNHRDFKTTYEKHI